MFVGLCMAGLISSSALHAEVTEPCPVEASNVEMRECYTEVQKKINAEADLHSRLSAAKRSRISLNRH